MFINYSSLKYKTINYSSLKYRTMVCSKKCLLHTIVCFLDSAFFYILRFVY